MFRTAMAALWHSSFLRGSSAGVELEYGRVMPKACRSAHAQHNVQQWAHRFKNAQDKSIRDLRAVKSARPAYTLSYIIPTKDESKCVVKSACFGLSKGALTSGYLLY